MGERTVELKVETKGDSKEVKATKEGRQQESRIPEHLPDTSSNSSSTPLQSDPSPNSSSCYNIEDILSEIVLPPPLSPQLEDLTNFREEERRSHLACRERLSPSSTCQQRFKAGNESSCPMNQCQPSSQPHLLSIEVKRPSLLGHPKYRAREERRRLLKLCQRKLRSIEDPEQILRRAVLINNTLKQLQAKEVCPGEEREGWGRQCEEGTVEVKVETKGDSKEVKATKEGRQQESRIPEVPDTSNSSSTPLSTPPPATSCYNIEDILSEIVLPPPPLPQLEDLTNFREEERRSH